MQVSTHSLLPLRHFRDGVTLAWCTLRSQHGPLHKRFQHISGGQKLTSAERAKIHYEIGTRHIIFSESACSELQTSWAAACPKTGELVIHESHQDCVTQLPEGGVLLASSQDTRVEVWALGDCVLCIQGQTRAACTPLPGQYALDTTAALSKATSLCPCHGCR